MNDGSAELLALYRDGDQQAAEALFRRYVERLIALAHSRLSAKLARRIDPEDVVQSAYRSFFVGIRNGRYTLECGGDLWRLLAGITLNKLQHQVERHTAEKRSINREQPASSMAHGHRLPVEAPAREPSPEEAAAVVELLEQVMLQLEPLSRRMVEMRLQGHSLEEIAAQTCRSERTVRRLLERVRQQLEEECR